LKKNICGNFMSKRHHGESVKTLGGFVDIFNAFLLKNLESYIVIFQLTLDAIHVCVQCFQK